MDRCGEWGMGIDTRVSRPFGQVWVFVFQRQFLIKRRPYVDGGRCGLGLKSRWEGSFFSDVGSAGSPSAEDDRRAVRRMFSLRLSVFVGQNIHKDLRLTTMMSPYHLQ